MGLLSSRAGATALAVVLGVAATFVFSAQSGSALDADDVSSRFIVVLRGGVDVDATTSMLESAHGFKSTHRYRHALHGFAATLSREQVEGLNASSAVAFVSADAVAQAQGMVPLMPSETAPPGLRRVGAATTTTAHEAAKARVAVIDTGVQLSHPDLNVRSGTNCLGPGPPADDNGHGTHVAGIIGAKNTGAGIVGVAPGTRIIAVKVLNAQGGGLASDVICGIDWVTANGPGTRMKIRVANMSLGLYGSDDNNCGRTNNDPMHLAICNSTAAGITYVAAAMNYAKDLASETPATYGEVLTATAMTDTDGIPGGLGPAPTCQAGQTDDSYATFSDWAVSSSDAAHTIAGPGVCVYSTWTFGGYGRLSGTSMATPHVAGAVALCIGNGRRAGPCRRETPAQIIQRIRADAAAHATPQNGFNGDPNHSVPGRFYGYLVWSGGY